MSYDLLPFFVVVVVVLRQGVCVGGEGGRKVLQDTRLQLRVQLLMCSFLQKHNKDMQRHNPLCYWKVVVTSKS